MLLNMNSAWLGNKRERGWGWGVDRDQQRQSTFTRVIISDIVYKKFKQSSAFHTAVRTYEVFCFR